MVTRISAQTLFHRPLEWTTDYGKHLWPPGTNCYQWWLWDNWPSFSFPSPIPTPQPLYKPSTRNRLGSQFLSFGELSCTQALFNKLYLFDLVLSSVLISMTLIFKNMAFKVQKHSQVRICTEYNTEVWVSWYLLLANGIWREYSLAEMSS